MPASSSPSTSQRLKTRLHIWLRAAVYSGVILLLCASIGSRLGRFHWSADWLALFIDSYFWLSIGYAVILVMRKKWGWGMVALALILLNGSLLWGYVPTIPTSRAAEQTDLRLYVFNMYYRNDDLDQMVTDIQTQEPDIVFLQEYSFDIQSQIEAEFKAYPYQLVEPSRFTMGVALFSKFPFDQARVHRFEETRIPIVEAIFTVAGEQVRIVGGHPWPPLPQWGTLHRRQIADIERVATQRHTELPLIVAGDFNASPWSFALRSLAQATDTQDAARGHGWQKSFELAPWFKLPLDHILISERWQVVHLAYGARGGSDHKPLLVDLQLE